MAAAPLPSSSGCASGHSRDNADGSAVSRVFLARSPAPPPTRFRDRPTTPVRDVTSAREREADFRADLLSVTPSLRAFALSLVGDRDRADDLVQDTLLRALQKQDRFEPGTNVQAWLFTIRGHAIE